MQTKAQRESQIRAAIAYQKAGGDVSGLEWNEYRAAMLIFPPDSEEPLDWQAFYRPLTVRLRNVLKREGINSFESLLANSETRTGSYPHPMEWKNCGERTLSELITAMKNAGVPIPDHW